MDNVYLVQGQAEMTLNVLPSQAYGSLNKNIKIFFCLTMSLKMLANILIQSSLCFLKHEKKLRMQILYNSLPLADFMHLSTPTII